MKRKVRRSSMPVERIKTPRQERSQQTVDAILTATSRVLVSRGYEKTTTTEVARLAGVSVGSLYQYYPSKEGLVAALIDRHIERMIATVAGALAEANLSSMHETLRALLRSVLEMHVQDLQLHAVITQNFPQVSGIERVRGLNAQLQALVQSQLEAHREEVAPKNLELAAFMAVHAVQAIISAAVVDPSKSLAAPEFAECLTDLVGNFLFAGREAMTPIGHGQ